MNMQDLFDEIPIGQLLPKTRELRQAGARLVAISATRLAEQLELTYSFEKDQQLTNLRLHLPAEGAKVPSITSIFWCAFLYENELHDLFNVQVENLAVDFHGNLYQTSVKFPFGSTKPRAVKSVISPSDAGGNGKPAATPAGGQ